MATNGEPDEHIAIGPPPAPTIVKLGVAVMVLMMPVLVASLLASGAPVVALGITVPVPVLVWTALRPFRRIRVTAWNHRLEIENGRGRSALDRDAIAGFEIGVPSITVILQEGPGQKPFSWKGHVVHAVLHDGRRVPLFATLRRHRDANLQADRARLEAWLHPPGRRQ
jgi:hypothetical protein